MDEESSQQRESGARPSEEQGAPGEAGLQADAVPEHAPGTTGNLLTPGTEVGPFTIVAFAGRGGMGEVYRAFDPRLDRYVALKVLSRKSIGADYRARFIREAKATASLNHANIAQIYDIGETSGACYIAVEYIDGETLRQRMSAPDCTLAELLEYLRQTAEAVAAAHAHGVVHCDLKPDNIMVTREGVAKVLDFGLAKLVHRYRDDSPFREDDSAALTLTLLPDSNVNVIAGTIGYMSPEQAEGRTGIDQRSDVFSFGCVLYEAITGRLPLAGSSIARSLHNLLYERFPPISSLCPNTPPALQRIADRCLEKDPAERYPSMGEVSRELGDLLRETETRLPVRRMPEPSARPAASRPRREWPSISWRKLAGIAALFAIAAFAAVAYLHRTQPEAMPSVGVIPLVGAQSAPDIQYLSDGVGENLIHALARLPDVKVVARSSSFKFRGEKIDIRQAARALGVQMIVTVRATGDGKGRRIAAELIDGSDGRQLWGTQYSSTAAEMPGMESALAREIAERIRSKLTQTELARLGSAAKVKPEAYELLLRGRYHMRLHTPDDSLKAAGYYQQSIAIDPAYAVAHAELAHVYRLLGGSAILPAEDTIPKAQAEALRALAADPNLAEAHATLGDIRKDRWEWAAAESAYRRAIQLSPNLAIARRGLAIYLSVAGRFREAISEVETARQLDPLSVPTGVDAGAVYYNARRFDRALEVLKRTLELDPAAAAAWTWIAMSHGAEGRFIQATEAYERAIALGDDTTATQCYYAYSLARSGRREETVRIIEQLRRSRRFVSKAALAVAYLGLDQRERALAELEAAYTARDPLVQYLQVEAHFDAISSEPRFRQICAKLGLPHLPASR